MFDNTLPSRLFVLTLLLHAPTVALADEADSEVIAEPEGVPPVAESSTVEATSEVDATAEAEASKSLVVLPLRAIDVDPEVAVLVSEAVVNAAANLAGLRVLSRADLQQLLAHQEDLAAAACVDDECIAQISKLAQTRWVLSGSIGRSGELLVVHLALTDTERSTAAGGARAEGTDLETLSRGIEGAVAEALSLLSTTGGDVVRFKLAPGQTLNLAILDLEAHGLADTAAANLTQTLAAELKAIEGTSVISRDDVVAVMQAEAERMQMGCSDEMACLVELGGALGVEKLVVGSVGKLAESYVVSMRLVDVSSVTVDDRISESFRGAESQLLHAVAFAGRRLLGVEPDDAGALALTTSNEEATIYIDNESVGVAPLAAIEALKPGRHAIRITKDGFHDWHSDFYIAPARTTSLWAQLSEIPPAWYQRWWVWAATGAVAVGGGVFYVYRNTQVPDTDLGTYPR